ncbi:hypothetical protein [Deinococcus rubellus]|uniref:hypothetical protein n=1 Tax=Deinococcus rubellus TaxID=1889240 RepID=UPI0031F0CB39
MMLPDFGQLWWGQQVKEVTQLAFVVLSVDPDSAAQVMGRAKAAAFGFFSDSPAGRLPTSTPPAGTCTLESSGT